MQMAPKTHRNVRNESAKANARRNAIRHGFVVTLKILFLEKKRKEKDATRDLGNARLEL
jgi:hypothetical protein